MNPLSTSKVYCSAIVGQLGVAILDDRTAWLVLLAPKRHEISQTFQLHLVNPKDVRTAPVWPFRIPGKPRRRRRIKPSIAT